MALGKSIKFDLDRFTLPWNNSRAISIAFTSIKEVDEFYRYLDDVDNFKNIYMLPTREEIENRMSEMIAYVNLWRYPDTLEYRISSDKNVKTADSDYYYSDIIFKGTITISTDDLMDFLKG